MKSGHVWVVWGTRGEYSDQCHWLVRAYDTKERAASEAWRMTVVAREQRRRVMDEYDDHFYDDENPGPVLVATRLLLGDAHYAPSCCDTTYTAVEVPFGENP